MSKAFVVKKLASTASRVLVVDKKILIANFASPQNVPEIGAVITIEYRYAEDFIPKASNKTTSIDKVDIINWRVYNGYNSMMFRLSSKLSDETLRFTGYFYTCGCVRYKEKPLTNPAIFNDVIGVVEDSRNVLDRKYIGKLLATVIYSESGSDYEWELCYINKYLKKDNIESDHLPFHGIVGALSEIPSKACYITSRDFPHDVRFFRERNTASLDVESLLGKEVYFHARKGVDAPFMSFYVLGNIEPGPKNSAARIYSNFDKFFSLTLDVEYIGCTDENGITIVWSDKWEFISDPYCVFRNRDYGIYRVEIIRQYAPKQFPRWKIKRIVNRVENYSSIKKNYPISVTQSVEHPEISPSFKLNSESIRCYKDEHKNDESGLGLEQIKVDASSLRSNVRKVSPRIPIKEGGSHREEVNEEVEHELHSYMHECLKSRKVRAAIKQADPELLDALVKAIMRV